MVNVNKNEFLFVEKYRPQTVEECVLPERIKSRFRDFVKQGNIPNLLLTGGPGMGKTTIARAMCEDVGCDYLLINGSNETGIDLLRGKITNYASSVSLSGGRKVIIIDEADFMNANSLQPALRGAIEEFSSNCSFIFTCNFKNKLIAPLRDSRFAVIDFKFTGAEKAELAKSFYKRIQEILDLENIKYDPKTVVSLVMKYFPDNRRILGELQNFSSSGEIDSSILSQITDVNVKELISALKEKNFPVVRKWIGLNSDNDTNSIYRKIYDTLSTYMEESSIPPAILIIAKYQYQSAFTVDPEINLMACMIELMVDCEFQ